MSLSPLPLETLADPALFGSRQAARELANALVETARAHTPEPATMLALARALKARGRLDEPAFAHDTALSLAARWHFRELMEELLALGADPNAPGINGLAPLALAIEGLSRGGARGPAGAMECMGTLIAAGAQIDALDPQGRGALHWAASTRRGHEPARWLIQAGASVSIQQGERFAPLHCAAREGRGQTASLLIEAGANLFALAWDSAQGKRADPAEVARYWSQTHGDQGLVASLIDAQRASVEKAALQRHLPRAAAPRRAGSL